MGPELALALAAGGTGASMLGQQQAAGERRDIMNRQLARADQTQGKVTTQVMDEAKKFAPSTRMADMAANEQRVFDQSQKDLGAASGIPAAADNGAQSADYLAAKTASDASEGNRMSAIAREIAKTRAPGEMMTGEGIRRANLTGDVAHQWGVDKNMANASMLDAENVQEPWWGQLGKIAAMAGMAGGMAGPAAATGAGTTGVTGANGAFLGEGAGSGVGAWDQAMLHSPKMMFATPPAARSWWTGGR